jgi:hypothetical protein
MKPYRNERSHCEDQKEVQNWAIKVVSDVSGLSGDKTSAFVIQSTCEKAVGSIDSIFKGRAHKPANMIHTVPIPKPGCLLAPICHTVASLVSCLNPWRTCSNTSLRTEGGFPSAGYLTSAGRLVPTQTNTYTHTHTHTQTHTHTHTGTIKDKWPVGFCLPVSLACLRIDFPWSKWQITFWSITLCEWALEFRHISLVARRGFVKLLRPSWGPSVRNF